MAENVKILVKMLSLVYNHLKIRNVSNLQHLLLQKNYWPVVGYFLSSAMINYSIRHHMAAHWYSHTMWTRDTKEDNTIGLCVTYYARVPRGGKKYLCLLDLGRSELWNIKSSVFTLYILSYLSSDVELKVMNF